MTSFASDMGQSPLGTGFAPPFKGRFGAEKAMLPHTQRECNESHCLIIKVSEIGIVASK
jgi:hypothetical protein